MKERNSKKLKDKMEGRWVQALSMLAPSLDYAISNLGKSVPCPVNGGKDGFRLFGERDKVPTSISGGGVCHSYKIFPEGIGLLMWVNNWSFPKTYDELEAWLGDKPIEIGVRHQPKPKSKRIKDEANYRRWLNMIWKEAVPLDDPKAYPARLYFSNRGILNAALSAHDLRFHPLLNYKDQDGKLLGKFGAVLSLVCANDGKPVSIHRTYITKSGLKVNFGDDNTPKKSLTAVGDRLGRMVVLFDAKNGCLGVCEGLETALAVYEAKQFPVWPNLSNTNLHSFIAQKGVHTVLNFIDKDRSKAGENSAVVLRNNLFSKGVRVIDLLPPTPILETDEKGVDWADQLQRDLSGFDLIDKALDLYRLKTA